MRPDSTRRKALMKTLHAAFALAAITGLLLTFAARPALAEEIIERYNSAIEIMSDGDLRVTETITVHAEGVDIRHGIYRDLPRFRRTSFGGAIPMEYTVLSTRRDGAAEPHHAEAMQGTLRLYIGDPDETLTPGQYTYELVYRVADQVFFFDGYDELNWNAIGTGWSFPIKAAQADIYLPGGAPVRSHAAYTGKALSSKSDIRTSESDGRLSVTAENELPPGEGLTVAVSWPKGYVQAAKNRTGFSFFLIQHRGLIIMLAALAATALYYGWAWAHFGRDPRRRRLAPFYDAPKNVSPAMAAYIQRMGDASPGRCMTAAVISLAAKGYLEIAGKEHGDYLLTPKNGNKDAAPLSGDEKIIRDKITHPMIIGSASKMWENLAQKHEECLESQCVDRYFIVNTWRWAAGILPFLAAGALLYFPGLVPLEYLIACAVILVAADMIRQMIRLPRNILALVPVAAMMVPCAAVLMFVFGSVSWLVIALTVILLSVVIVMHPLMKAPTQEGVGVMEHIDGLQYYMEAVEEKILQKFDPPQMSRELYEKFLPYAVALGVESKWAEKLAVALAATMTAEQAIAATRPHWYGGAGTGSGASFSLGAMAGSFSSALSAATSPPSSSGGGGSVGGGGGGGGGGGW